MAAPPGLCRYEKNYPLILWTDFPPDHGGGGAVVVRSLLGADDRAKIVWVSPAIGAERAGAGVLPLRAGSLGRTARRSVLLDSTLLAGALAEETLRLAAARRARALWIVLHGAGVPVAAEIVKRRRIAVHVTVHDDPAFGVALRSRQYFALSLWIERQLGRALQGADSVDVIGEGMRERYRQRYGVNSVVVHRTVPGPVASSAPYDVRANGLHIGVLGNMYAYEQLPVLGRALARASRAVGARARITMIGHGFANELRRDLAGDGVAIESPGHVDEAEAVRILRNCFALYLNYPFAARDAVLRETSFPTKLGTYVLAARPLITHAPHGTTLAPLASYTGYVYPWTTMREVEGKELLVRMWNDPHLIESKHDAAEAVRARYYDMDRNRRSLMNALDGLVSPLQAGPGDIACTWER